jgi:hypothetical protein
MLSVGFPLSLLISEFFVSAASPGFCESLALRGGAGGSGDGAVDSYDTIRSQQLTFAIHWLLSRPSSLPLNFAFKSANAMPSLGGIA